jgi:signal transduction histidine kinase
MFLSARLKLTGWYVMTVMAVSLAFSLVIYSLLTKELGKFEVVPLSKDGMVVETQEVLLPADSGIVNLWRSRIKQALWAINVAILVVSTSASYMLAGKALAPIQNSMEEQQRFVSDASHELRTPLAAMRSEIEVAIRDKNLELDEAKKVLVSNLEEVDSLNRLTSNLLEMNRYKTKKSGVVMENVDVNMAVEEAVKKVRPQAEKKQIVITVIATLANIKADKQGVVRVMTILLDNAVKYSGENQEITVETKKLGKRVLIEVTDKGIGISKQDLPHIFDRFFRADKSRSKLRFPGYGLGLTIAKEIVEANGGEIKVRSKLNKGTKFSVVLPEFE